MNPELHRICTRLVAIEEERKTLADEAKAIKDAAKADGFDTTLITKTVKLMMLDGEKRRAALDQIELFDSYLAGVGLIDDRDDAGDDPAEDTAPGHSPAVASPAERDTTPMHGSQSARPGSAVACTGHASEAEANADGDTWGAPTPPPSARFNDPDDGVPAFLRRREMEATS